MDPSSSSTEVYICTPEAFSLHKIFEWDGNFAQSTFNVYF